jgi:hypothetical protein
MIYRVLVNWKGFNWFERICITCRGLTHQAHLVKEGNKKRGL